MTTCSKFPFEYESSGDLVKNADLDSSNLE